eukprot:m.8361 g.8361  ORF g.8361 m.8361 type:complete len:745 (+) comp5350_c0_seq1:180-2414(+)
MALLRCTVTALLVLVFLVHSSTAVVTAYSLRMNQPGWTNVVALENSRFGFTSAGLINASVSCIVNDERSFIAELFASSLTDGEAVHSCQSSNGIEISFATNLVTPIWKTYQFTAQTAGFYSMYLRLCAQQPQSNASSTTASTTASITSTGFLTTNVTSTATTTTSSTTTSSSTATATSITTTATAVAPSEGADPGRYISCQVKLAQRNGDSFLSSDEVHLPITFQLLTGVWAVLFVVAIVLQIVYRKYSTTIHTVLHLATFLKLAQVTLQLILLSIRRESGTEYESMTKLQFSLRFAESAMFYVFILFVSDGYCIVMPKLDTFSLIYDIAVPIFYFAMSLLYYFVRSYFIAIVAIALFIMSWKFFRTSMETMLELRTTEYNFRYTYWTQYRVRNPDSQPPTDEIDRYVLPLTEKITLVRIVRTTATMYGLFWVLFSLISAFIEDQSWLETVVFEAMELVAYSVLLYYFRLRDLRQFNEPKVEPEPVEIEVSTCVGPKQRLMGVLLPTSLAPHMFNTFIDLLEQQEEAKHARMAQLAAERLQRQNAEGHSGGPDGDGGDGDQVNQGELQVTNGDGGDNDGMTEIQQTQPPPYGSFGAARPTVVDTDTITTSDRDEPQARPEIPFNSPLVWRRATLQPMFPPQNAEDDDGDDEQETSDDTDIEDTSHDSSSGGGSRNSLRSLVSYDQLLRQRSIPSSQRDVPEHLPGVHSSSSVVQPWSGSATSSISSSSSSVSDELPHGLSVSQS